ncbi:hypothetical protein [Phocicoccus pinnipedialis]|uniref:Uncharacterized protein n=1 Tax=Phocicoccus pinnipedialis TaxID=110845 RepID=A0A6V7R7R0_9BACL|nr:hypothetical protein [Jeotgalicoccus pinnipedialis]MBP1938839.1 hypothetical protein [Jeotgalicoccus pinnipedialis]CAD2073336.1 hypothetical protein JEOPIN946_00705 [Jeotgalicoccus pinnipedialis]
MFGLNDLISLIISIFIILPVVAFIREASYLLAGALVGVENARVTIGSGRKLFKINMLGLGQLEVRRNYHLYSWFSFDDLKKNSILKYIILYASPIVVNATIGITLNALIANGYFDEYATFFNRFIFYIFFYVLLDALPMHTINGMPNNGQIIMDLILHGKRVDSSRDHFIPSTSEVDDHYETVKEDLEGLKDDIDDIKNK